MKKNILSAIVLVVILSVCGCSCYNCKEATIERSDPTIIEIAAIKKLDYEKDRVNLYVNVASRKVLDDGAQVFLVCESLGNLEFDDSKKLVLASLIANSIFSEAAENAILNRVNQLNFEETKKSIMQAINSRRNIQAFDMRGSGVLQTEENL